MSLPEDITRAVALIHTAPPRLVYAFAGAGSLALYWLHAVAGSSRTVLEARDCYAPISLAEVAGAPPEQAVSAPAALAMAAWAARRAEALAECSQPLVGLACTAAIATDRKRHGADRAFVAVQDAARKPQVYELALVKGAGRLVHEDQVSRLVILVIARACGVAGPALDLGLGEVLREG